jgi:hypothetical protein
MANIDYCSRCDCVVNEDYDPSYAFFYGVCMCMACREWALRKDEKPNRQNSPGPVEAVHRASR